MHFRSNEDFCDVESAVRIILPPHHNLNLELQEKKPETKGGYPSSNKDPKSFLTSSPITPSLITSAVEDHSFLHHLTSSHQPMHSKFTFRIKGLVLKTTQLPQNQNSQLEFDSFSTTIDLPTNNVSNLP